jgi:hypothetical protein
MTGSAPGFLSTVSQPVSTTGENAITSTFCAMRTAEALIWFSCFCCASEKRRSMLLVSAADLSSRYCRTPFAFGADLAEAEHDAPSFFLGATGEQRAGGTR